MKITEYRAYEILCWLDDQAGDHTNLFEQMTLYRDAASLIRQLQAEVQDAWHAGLDAGREQGKDHAHQPPSAPVGDSLLQTALRNLPQYISKSGLVGPDMHSAMQCFEVLRDALAQQPAASAVALTVCCGREECGGECGNEWRGMEWVRITQQPAAVDGAMVERAAIAVFAADSGSVESWPNATEREREFCRRIARAALAAQPGGSDNDH